MRVLCPACEQPVALAEGAAVLACPCGLNAPVSKVGTAPGVGLVPLTVELTGASVGGWQVDARIGAGGMGTVYRATRDGETMALKVLHADLRWRNADAVARFRREVEALRRLDHPNIVRIVDHGHDDAVGADFLVTALVDGPDLAKLTRERRLEPAEVVAVMRQVCAAVGHAHAQGIVHRDLKPANLLRGPDGTVQVADFGLAQMTGLGSAASLTRTDVVIGTIAYLAPEQRAGQTVDGRADVFALGVIFYELLCGALPVGRFPLPGELGRGDRRHDEIVRRALAPDPAHRYPTVGDLAIALAALEPRRRRRRWPIAAAAAALVTGVSAAFAVPAMLGGDPGSGPVQVDAGAAVKAQTAPPPAKDPEPVAAPESPPKDPVDKTSEPVKTKAASPATKRPGKRKPIKAKGKSEKVFDKKPDL